MHIPDRARLGLGTINLLAQLQSAEHASIDALVARAVALYHRETFKTTSKEHAWLETPIKN
jgi:hypothetical protein